ncbi:DNA polymerase III subunit alpha [Exilibacterium tricleocarpae]|uniref:Error-prone DNA polymerase n=1 Tax=Exilibacterium tricleocarpae TaxID=2591008 RepID=A0A545SQQ1_9GAMM|nr:error-prone DNA polymerase [Exilibacterium tricleocarpae]TQV67291.1 DNA polymerase III subunit alpha [Exilibacterium tricleocarpae]
MVGSPDAGSRKQSRAEPGFVELHCISNYSFLRGASHPEELVHQAMTAGYAGLALTDECSVAGVVKAWQQLQQQPVENFSLIIGSEFRYRNECFVVLATDKLAYSELCRLISACRQAAPKGDYVFHPRDLVQYIRRGLLLWRPATAAPDYLPALTAHFRGRFWLLVELSLTDADEPHQRQVETIARDVELPIVCSNNVHMHDPKRKMLQDTLTAIRLNRTVTEIKQHLLPNAENYLRPLKNVRKIYKQAYILESLVIAERCHFRLEEIKYLYPKTCVPAGLCARDYLRQATYEGARRRYGDTVPEQVKATIEKELGIIAELNYEYYFLTIYDIVKQARKMGILCQGRGSAANSVVCYCLHITEVDPTEVSLLFERFISRRRNEPPDIDVDFENARREEVIQYIYEKYGRDHCAIAATVITYRAKSALRDLAKALGINMLQLENVIANYGWRYRDKHNWVDEVITPALSLDNHMLDCFKQLLTELVGFPRHLSQHVGGFVISEPPLIDLVPIENAAMADRTVIQWDKEDLEALGLMKVDVLALGMLTALRKCFTYISTASGKPVAMSSIPRDDPRVYGMLQKADTVGLFQVESRAQMNMLPRLRPEKYYDLVVQVAIVRPGPIHGDMVHPYLRRKHGEERVDVPLKELEPILNRTYGVPIFQEQVIALAIKGADFTPDEAEELRRSMASWKREGHMHRLRQKLTDNLLRKGVSQDYVERICRQIEGFGEYGFPESHAASFALLAYASAWLKYYHPTAFLCALLNSQPMGFYRPWQLIQDAQRHGVTVLPVDINRSEWDYTLERRGEVLRLGLRSIKGLSEPAAELICRHRPARGYAAVEDLFAIPGIDKDTLETLASANALAPLGGHRFQQRWNTSGFDFYRGLFAAQAPQGYQIREPSRIEDLFEDHAMLGFSLHDHPMAYLRDQGVLSDCIAAELLGEVQSGTELYIAGVVINRQRPKTSAGVTFLTLEDETGSMNVIIWLQNALRQMEELVKARILKIYGLLEQDKSGGVIHVIAYRLFDISSQLERFSSKSRDYH